MGKTNVRWWRGFGAACTLAVGLLAHTPPAFAAEQGSIDHVEPGDGAAFKVLYSIPDGGTDVELDSVSVTVDDEPVEATAFPAGEDATDVRRTAVLAVDVSKSMAGEKFEQAKLAALAFLDTAPADLYVGIVTFAGEVETVLPPTTDRSASESVLNALTLSTGTRLYDGVMEAVKAAGQEGQRNILVLSDGKDTAATPLTDVVASINDAELKVDVVALGQSESDVLPLQDIALAGSGAVLAADDPQALRSLFAAEAEALAEQLLIEVEVPQGLAAHEATLAVSVDADGRTYRDTAFVPLRAADGQQKPAARLHSVEPSGFMISSTQMLVGLGAAALAALFLLLTAFGVFDRAKTETLEDRIAAYSRTKDPRAAAGMPGVRLAKPQRPESLTGSAVSVAEKALATNRGLEASLGSRLEAAGMAMKPAEWLLLHAAITVGASVFGFLMSSAQVLPTLLFAVAGIVVPWFYLGMKRRRRVKAFNGQLADVLQLMSGSLSAGLSLAQSADTVVREGTEPVAGEFRRALVEARLGVPIEDALDSVAERMESDDFHWVVMAVRIQREVGGNLAELLLTVAATLREREYLRRQVKALSAEGRMSAWILGGLPPAFLAYLSLINPGYLTPLFSTALGWLLVVTMAVLMSIGVFWMSKMVKVEV